MLLLLLFRSWFGWLVEKIWSECEARASFFLRACCLKSWLRRESTRVKEVRGECQSGSNYSGYSLLTSKTEELKKVIMSDGWWWLESWLTAMALSKSQREKWQNKQNKWLAAVLVASLNFVHVFKTTGGIWWVAAGQLSNRGMQAGSVVGIFVCVCSQSIQNKTVWRFAGGHVVVQNWFRHQKWRRAWTTVCVMHKQEMRSGCLGMTWC